MLEPLIVVDMDGVLVDFCKAAYMIHAKPYDGFEPKHFDFFEDWGLTADEFWAPIDKAGPGWWAELPVFPWAGELIHHIKRQGNFVIATACSRHAYSSHGKVVAIQRLFGNSFRDYFITPRKWFLAGPNRVLIDDYEENVDKFVKHGGNAILFPQSWNLNRDIVDPVAHTVKQLERWNASVYNGCNAG